MARYTPGVFLGDLAWAIDRLGILDDACSTAVARLLGLQPPESASGGASSSAVARVVRPEETHEVKPQEASEQGRFVDKASVEIHPPPDDEEVIPTLLSVSSEPPTTLAITPADLEPLDRAAEESVPPLPLEPLFLPSWTPRILTAALATNGEDGPIDTERIVATLARVEPLLSLPRLPWPTLRRGVQLLVDQSDAMLPYTRDQAWLESEIRRVAGEGRVEMLRFAGCPTRGVGGDARRVESTYRPPLIAGTLVLLLTDLGIGRPPSMTDSVGVGEWLAFAEIVRKAGCPLVAFVPYPPNRWPRALARAICLLLWDRRTTATSVRNRVGKAHEVPR